ncbi:SpoIIE family protein phosphatase [Streptomyces sp. NPDC058691]|uniref:ATP-binding SpoIIE family protein phosphatase n=1 Tax=Streptomyces sp. NPDC058691 TaxID=3346601 RepID=UPI00364B10F0
MRSIRPGKRFAVLVLCVALFSGLQAALAAAHIHVMGLPEYSMLIPVVAGALLSLRQTVIVGVLNLAAVSTIYGSLRPDIGFASQIMVVTALAVALGISAAVCRVRVAGEDRLERLMIARDRLSLLSEAGRRVGSSLSVTRTAEELAEVAVPGFADHVTVDIFDWVLRGEDGTAGPQPDDATLRRTARRSRSAALPGTARPGEAVTYPQGSAPALCLMTGEPVRAEVSGTADAACRPLAAMDAGADTAYSALAVPLRARGVTVGAALFTRTGHRVPFDADDVLLAREIGTRAAVYVDNAYRYTRERTTSLELQRSLLPQVAARQPAVTTATRYVAADSRAGVGGDWFDVIPLSGARVALVVGDVVGHGLHASATMGRLRTAVRTLADIDLPPDELLTHLDDLVIRLGTDTDGAQPTDAVGAQPSELAASCLYMIYDPVSRSCTAARAGHPPPALVRPGSPAEYLDIPAGPPLGVGGIPFETVELRIPEGSLLALYTDGLVESPRDGLEEGLERLRKVLSEPMPSLESTCDQVLDLLVDDGSTDDVALVIARTRELDGEQVACWNVPEELAEVAHVRDLASRRLASWGLEELAFTSEVVISELVTNAIRYGVGPVQLRLIRGDTLILEVSDGSNTAPHLRRARVFDEGGRGLFIVAHLAERWGTRQRPDGKTIWAELPLQSGQRPAQRLA